MGYKIYRQGNELIHTKFGKLKYIQDVDIDIFEIVKLYESKGKYFIFYKGKIRRVRLNHFLGYTSSVCIKKNRKDKKCIHCKQDNFSYKCLECNKNKNFKCQCPQCKGKARIRRQNTCYNKESDNYIIACSDCFAEIQEYWKERWEEYNSSRL